MYYGLFTYMYIFTCTEAGEEEAEGNANTITVLYTEITPTRTLIACYKAATGGMGLISKTVVLPQN